MCLGNYRDSGSQGLYTLNNMDGTHINLRPALLQTATLTDAERKMEHMLARYRKLDQEEMTTRFNIDGLLLPPFLDNSEAISHDQYQTTSDCSTHVKTGQSIEDSGISSADNNTQQQEKQQSAKPVLPIIREAHIPKGASRMSEEVQSDYWEDQTPVYRPREPPSRPFYEPNQYPNQFQPNESAELRERLAKLEAISELERSQKLAAGNARSESNQNTSSSITDDLLRQLRLGNQQLRGELEALRNSMMMNRHCCAHASKTDDKPAVAPIKINFDSHPKQTTLDARENSMAVMKTIYEMELRRVDDVVRARDRQIRELKAQLSRGKAEADQYQSEMWAKNSKISDLERKLRERDTIQVEIKPGIKQNRFSKKREHVTKPRASPDSVVSKENLRLKTSNDHYKTEIENLKAANKELAECLKSSLKIQQKTPMIPVQKPTIPHPTESAFNNFAPKSAFTSNNFPRRRASTPKSVKFNQNQGYVCGGGSAFSEITGNVDNLLNTGSLCQPVKQLLQDLQVILQTKYYNERPKEKMPEFTRNSSGIGSIDSDNSSDIDGLENEIAHVNSKLQETTRRLASANKQLRANSLPCNYEQEMIDQLSKTKKVLQQATSYLQ